MLQYLVILGAIVNLSGSLYYIRETFSGQTKPNRVTWLLWSISPMIATFAALSTGIRWAALPVFMSGFVPFLVFVSSFANPKSYWKLEKFDYVCGALSIVALVLWVITKQPAIAIFFAIASDGFAALPTIIKSWKHPDTETVGTYWAGLFSALTSFFALKTFEFTELAFPIYLVLVCSSLVAASYGGKLKKKLVH